MASAQEGDSTECPCEKLQNRSSHTEKVARTTHPACGIDHKSARDENLATYPWESGLSAVVYQRCFNFQLVQEFLRELRAEE